MLAFAEWLINEQKNKKERKNERHTSQISRESGHNNQQGKTAGGNPQVTQQTVPVFTVPEL
jgi:hypothetical protein